jgi:hypothetical protein
MDENRIDSRRPVGSPAMRRQTFTRGIDKILDKERLRKKSGWEAKEETEYYPPHRTPQRLMWNDE